MTGKPNQLVKDLRRRRVTEERS